MKNRTYFRIEDQVAIDIVPVEMPATNNGILDFPLQVSPDFSLLNQLQSIENENSALLHIITEKDRSIGAYLKGINEKINLLATTIIQSNNQTSNMHRKTITLSEGGISLTYDKQLTPKTFIAIKMLLFPSNIGLLLYGQVVSCNKHSNEEYLLSISFEQLTKTNRQIIAKHVLQHQAKIRRDTINKNIKNNKS